MGPTLRFCHWFTVAFAICLVSAANAQSPLQIAWKDRYLTISGEFPGKVVQIHYLEAYCRAGSTDRDWSDTVIPHTSRLVAASEDHRRLEIEDRLEDGVIVRHVIQAGRDDVRFSVTATNPTDRVSAAHWAQPCMRVDRFTGTDPEQSRELYPPYIKRCFLMVDGKLTRLPTKPWALRARYEPGQVYVPAHVNRQDVNPRPLSELVPSSGLTGCFSADESMILAVAWEPYQEVFQGVITCMHNDFRIGGLRPQETKRVEGRLYIVPADAEQLIARFRADFATKEKDLD